MLVVRLRENSTPELVSDNFQFVWLTMWVSDHLVKRNIIHTASQHMYGEGYSCNADERWNIFTDALVI